MNTIYFNLIIVDVLLEVIAHIVNDQISSLFFKLIYFKSYVIANISIADATESARVPHACYQTYHIFVLLLQVIKLYQIEQTNWRTDRQTHATYATWQVKLEMLLWINEQTVGTLQYRTTNSHEINYTHTPNKT